MIKKRGSIVWILGWQEERTLGLMLAEAPEKNIGK